MHYNSGQDVSYLVTAGKVLKWHYAQFSFQKLTCNCHIFQKIAIYNDGWQINDNVIC